MNDEFRKDLIEKAARVETHEITDDDLAKINKHTLAPLKADDVFTFKVMAGDNELDDRNCEPFNLAALKDLSKLYIGKTVIKDHRRSADNQVARVYDSEMVQIEGKKTGADEQFTQLYLKCYMVRTSGNADLIKEIEAGIKKEVSTSSVPKKYVCGICGKDNMNRDERCAHWPGITYDGRLCRFTLDGAKDAYELSLVAVPAQPRAGACKHFVDETAPKEETQKETEPAAETGDGEHTDKTVSQMLAGFFDTISKN